MTAVNSPTLTIRRMTLDDIDRVHALDVLSFSMPWPHHSYRFELLENPNSLQWVAEAAVGADLSVRDGADLSVRDVGADLSVRDVGADLSVRDVGADLSVRPDDSGEHSGEHVGSPLRGLVGMIVVWLIVDEAHIATIAVHPDFRRRGIARELMVTAIRECITHGAVSATLEVRQHNLGAITLYRQLGFEAVGRRPRYYQDTHEDAIIMTVADLTGFQNL